MKDLEEFASILDARAEIKRWRYVSLVSICANVAVAVVFILHKVFG